MYKWKLHCTSTPAGLPALENGHTGGSIQRKWCGSNLPPCQAHPGCGSFWVNGLRKTFCHDKVGVAFMLLHLAHLKSIRMQSGLRSSNLAAFNHCLHWEYYRSSYQRFIDIQICLSGRKLPLWILWGPIYIYCFSYFPCTWLQSFVSWGGMSRFLQRHTQCLHKSCLLQILCRHHSGVWHTHLCLLLSRSAGSTSQSRQRDDALVRFLCAVTSESGGARQCLGMPWPEWETVASNKSKTSPRVTSLAVVPLASINRPAYLQANPHQHGRFFHNKYVC